MQTLLNDNVAKKITTIRKKYCGRPRVRL